MTRGGKPKERDAPERRCLATGVSGPKEPLIRFVLDPEGRPTPDLAERLPGRGVWISADRAALEKASKKNLFARGFKQATPPTPDLVERVERLLVKRVIEALALARKAGHAVAGFQKCAETAGFATVLFQAFDGAPGGKAKLRRLANEAREFNCLNSGELGLAFGRASVIHAALTPSGASARAAREARRLSGVRPEPPASKSGVGADDGEAEPAARSAERHGRSDPAGGAADPAKANE